MRKRVRGDSEQMFAGRRRRFQGAFLLLAMLVGSAPLRAEEQATTRSGAAAVVVRRSAPVHYRLANGLEVVIQADRSRPRIAVYVQYGIGARDDPPGYAGLAHLVEHLTYRGSRHVAPFGAMRHAEAVGVVDWNGETSADATTYYGVFPSSRLGLALWLESDRMAFTLEAMTPRAFELEQKIVLQETRLRGQHEDYGLHLRRALYPPGHPYRPSLDPLDDTAAITFDGARGFFQRAYRPSNARLVIVGDVAIDRARAEVERYFGPVQEPPVALVRRSVTREREGRLWLEYRANLAWDSIEITFRGPPAPASDREAVLGLVEAIEEQGPGTLHEELVEKRQVASRLDARVHFGELGTRVSVAAVLRPGARHADAEVLLDWQVRRLSASALDQDAVSRLRASRRLTLLRSTSRPEGIARVHLEALALQGKPFRLSDRVAGIEGLTPAALVRAARTYLEPQAAVVAHLVDDESLLPPDNERVRVMETAP